MRIGELGERVAVNPKTIRYYEEIGLLPDPARLPSGYRDYRDDDVDRLSFIKSAQRLGLSLSEIAEILGFRDRGERPCDYVLGVLDRQVADLDHRMAEMVGLRRELIALKRQADRLPDEPSCYCAVIEHTQPAGLTSARAEIGIEGGDRSSLTRRTGKGTAVFARPAGARLLPPPPESGSTSRE